MENYRYYSFTLNNISDIVEIDIYVTIIDGDVGILESTVKEYP